MIFYIFLLLNISLMLSSEYMEFEDENEITPLLINSEKSDLEIIQYTPQYLSDLEKLPLEVKLNIYSKINNFNLPILRAVNKAFRDLFAEKEYKELLNIIKIEKAVHIIRKEEHLMDLEDPYQITETLKTLNFLHKHWHFKTPNFRKIVSECHKLRYSPEFLTNNGEKAFKEFCKRYRIDYAKRSILGFCCSHDSDKDRIASCSKRIYSLITLTAILLCLLPTIYYHPKTFTQKATFVVIDGIIIIWSVYLCTGISRDALNKCNPRYWAKAKVDIVKYNRNTDPSNIV